MLKFVTVSSAILLLSAAGVANIQAETHDRALAVVMTNDPNANQIKVYDAETGGLLQTLSTNGKGGAGNNARGVQQFKGELFAAVNNGSNSVAVFRRSRTGLTFEKLVTTTSPPVSIDFANDHMYVAGATTVDSFAIDNGSVEWLDGTTALVLADGAAPPSGSTSQVGAINDSQVIVTLKNDPDPGTVDLVALKNGRITGAIPTGVSAPAGTLAPFGFAVYPDGSALITLAHSNQNGIFRDGAFAAVASAGQTANCWATRAGKYVFTANTASRTIGRAVGTGSHAFLDSAVAATIATGNPTDLDAKGGLLTVIDHGAGQSHLTFFTYNAFGELTARGAAISIGASNANGVALLAPSDRDKD
jgi:ribosomal protein L19